MERRYGFAGIAALVLLVVLVGIGAFAYQAGMAQGVAQGTIQGALLSGGEASSQWMPYYGLQFARPHWGFGGFGLLGCLLPLFLIFLFFGPMRWFFWHGPRRWGRYPKWAGQEHEPGKTPEAPPFVAEWHRRMHAAESEESDQVEEPGRTEE